ncbi:GtrA family protein [Microbacterium lacus]|uniref:GtrA family protein n=1 Tax=Microbacterium lacus TaxID=415217 RepID=UPI001E2F6BEA|nr:GtrA family protein [Microbacterium lacus]
MTNETPVGQVTDKVTDARDPRDPQEGPAPEPAAEAIGGMSGPDGPLLRLIKDRRIAFLIVGVTNTVVGFGWFVLFDLTIGRLWGYMATLLFAHVAAVLCAFILYRKFVFRVRGHVWVDLGRFELVYLTALGVNAILLPILVEFAHLQPIVAQALIVFVTTLISYFGHSRFSFRRKVAE